MSKMKYKRVSNCDIENINLAYAAGVCSLGMAYKMSITDIDLTDALYVEKEAIKMKKELKDYFEKFSPKMLLSISTSAMKIAKNLDKYKKGIIKYSI